MPIDIYFRKALPVDHIRDLVRNDKSILYGVRELKRNSGASIADSIRNKLYLAGITNRDADRDALMIKNKVVEETLNDRWLESIEPGIYASLDFHGPPFA